MSMPEDSPSLWSTGGIGFATPTACEATHQARLQEIREKYRFGFGYRQLGMRLFWLIPVALLVPPALLYGALLGVVKVARWLRDGFQTL
jgi:hypothetical protein